MELDSSCAITLIQNPLDQKHPYAALILRIHQLIQRDWDVRVMHSFREANRAADCLAALGHTLPLGVHFYSVPPIALRGILSEDSRGIALPRLIF